MLENPFIKVENLEKYFAIEHGLFGRSTGMVKAVDGVSLQIYHGEVLGLVGESGSGKTTLGRLILGLIKPDKGKILVNDEDLNSILRKQRMDATRRLQIIFQDPYNSLDPRMKIADIILEGLYVRKVSAKVRSEKLKTLMDMVGLTYGHKDRLPHQFSGGQRQRVAIARALALDPEFLVLDEPISNLDVSIQAQILNLFYELQNRLKLTYLFISHDLRVVHWISDRICVMKKGKIVETQNSRQLFANPRHDYTRELLAAVGKD